ncbi:MAG TPA: AmmeMemoRadiSam system protein B [Propionibacteriaceae bacterium]
MTVRPPAVAGQFYPAHPARLRRMISDYLAEVNPESVPAAAYVVPHAGYIYSGSTAAHAYAALALEPPSRILLLGPTHRVYVEGLALSGADGFETPLGVVRTDRDLEAALRESPAVSVRPDVHAEEHSLEVQLPFLQVVAPGVPVVPVAVGAADATTVADVVEIALGLPGTLLLVSTDLSHYHPYAEAAALDADTIERIIALDRMIPPDRACGAYPLNGALVAAQRHSWTPELLSACSSGDTAGTRDGVVGYAAFRLRIGHA